LGNADVTIDQVIPTDQIKTLTFEPAAGEYKTPYAAFKFQVSDGNEYSAASYTATINVNNAAPTSADFSKTINTTNGTLKLDSADVTINKVITIADIQDEKLIFTPDNGEKGTPYAAFKFQVSDGNEYSAASYTATINVNNAKPTLIDDADGNEISIYTNQTHTFNIADFNDNFTDANNDAIAEIKITALPDNGTLKHNGAAISLDTEYTISGLTYTPNTNKSGGTTNDASDNYASFAFKASDGTDYSINSASVYIDITNRAPTATDISITKYDNADITISFNTFNSHYSDPDGSPLNEVTILTLPSEGYLKGTDGGNVAVNATIAAGTDLIFTPLEFWMGETTFTWRANDGTTTTAAGSPADANTNSNTANAKIIITDVPQYIPVNRQNITDSFSANSTDYQARTPSSETTRELTVTSPELPDVTPLNLYVQTEILSSEINFRDISASDTGYKAEKYQNKMASILFTDTPINYSNAISASVTYEAVSMNTIYFLDNIDKMSISEYTDNKALVATNNYLAALSQIPLNNFVSSSMSENKIDMGNTYYSDSSDKTYYISLKANINYNGNEMIFFDSIAPDKADMPVDDELMLIHAQQIKKYDGMFNNFKKIAKK